MTDILLIILEALLTLIVLGTGLFLLTHYNRKFLMLNPEKEPSLKIILLLWGMCLLFLGILTFVACFILKSTTLIAIMLMLDAIFETTLSFIMLIFYNFQNN